MNCVVEPATQPLQLQRHGGRFPTLSAGTRIITAVSKFNGVTDFRDSNLDFLKTYAYDLGHDDLIPFGAAE